MVGVLLLGRTWGDWCQGVRTAAKNALPLIGEDPF